MLCAGCWIESIRWPYTHVMVFFFFFFASSTKTSPFILHTESVRICTCTYIRTYANGMHTLIFVRIHSHTHHRIHSLTGHIIHSNASFVRSFVYFAFGRSFFFATTSRPSCSHSMPLCRLHFFLNVFLSSIISCTLCATLYLNSNYHNATMQRFFLSLSCFVCVYCVDNVYKPIKAQHNTTQSIVVQRDREREREKKNLEWATHFCAKRVVQQNEQKTGDNWNVNGSVINACVCFLYFIFSDWKMEQNSFYWPKKKNCVKLKGSVCEQHKTKSIYSSKVWYDVEEISYDLYCYLWYWILFGDFIHIGSRFFFGCCYKNLRAHKLDRYTASNNCGIFMHIVDVHADTYIIVHRKRDIFNAIGDKYEIKA